MVGGERRRKVGGERESGVGGMRRRGKMKNVERFVQRRRKVIMADRLKC